MSTPLQIQRASAVAQLDAAQIAALSAQLNAAVVQLQLSGGAR